MERKKTKLYIGLASFALLISVYALLVLLVKPTINYTVYDVDKTGVKVNVQIKSMNIFYDDLYYVIDENPSEDINEWIKYSKDNENKLVPGNYYIHVRDFLGRIKTIGPIINNAYNIEITNDILDLYPIGYELDLYYNCLGYGDYVINVKSSNQAVATIVDNTVVTTDVGASAITLYSNSSSAVIGIEVTDLYTIEDTDSSNKPILKETICDSDYAAKLDNVLESLINQAGYKTRAGVVAAARFLSLQFPYKIAYFSESGRLDGTTGVKYADGEGRYYHKGLYLSEDKYDDIKASVYGPKYWGAYFHEDDFSDHSQDEEYLTGLLTTSDIGSHLYLAKRPNGLDCSGFVSWCYYNAGFDFGDMGAGGVGTYGMSQLGDFEYIDDELLQSDKIKAGDLVGFNAHVGIVIGVDENNIWIADTLITGIKVTKYERNVESFEALGEDAWKYFMLMDDEYKTDGNYTEMW